MNGGMMREEKQRHAEMERALAAPGTSSRRG